MPAHIPGNPGHKNCIKPKTAGEIEKYAKALSFSFSL